MRRFARSPVLRQLLLTGVLLLPTACSGPLSDRHYKHETAAVQNRIEGYLTQQRDQTDGAGRLTDFQSRDYQQADEIERIRRQTGRDREQLKLAAEESQRQPLTLEQCLLLAMQFNSQVLGAHAEMQAVGGEELVVRSRFVPKLSYRMDTEQIEHRDGDTGGATDKLFHLEQRFLEFGRDSVLDVALREQQRAALFTYENVIRQMLFDTRRVYFTILLRQQQIEQRQALLREFEQRYQQISELEDARRVREVDVLTARLNVLNEQFRINALEKEIQRQKIALIRLLGLPVQQDKLQIAGSFTDFDINVEKAVELALLRSTEVAQSRAVVWEQARQARQIKWQNAPEVSMRGGFKSADGEATVGLSRDAAGTYGVDGAVDARLDNANQQFADIDFFPYFDQEGWFFTLGLDAPIFDGGVTKGRKIREYARLERARYDLRGMVEQVEVDVRQAYQTLLERKTELAIQAETVVISKQRLHVQEQLKDLGKISDDELETFRNRFFDDQDAYFRQQIAVMEAQERLRFAMRYFDVSAEPKP